MKRIIELSENDYIGLKEDGVQNHLALADTVIANSVPYEERSQVEPEKIYLAKITFDKEQLQEIVDKAKVEVLASVERPQGEWVIDNWGLWHCDKCNQIKEQFSANYCCYCGADMRKGGAE